MTTNNEDDNIRKCQDNCNSLLFKDLCESFEKMEKLTGAEKKLQCLFSKERKRIVGRQSVFPLMRLIIPANDNERGRIGMHDKIIL